MQILVRDYVIVIGPTECSWGRTLCAKELFIWACEAEIHDYFNLEKYYNSYGISFVKHSQRREGEYCTSNVQWLLMSHWSSTSKESAG